MKISLTLSRYIAWRFLLAVSLVFLLCLALIFLIDFVDMLRQSHRSERATAWLAAGVSLLRVPIFAEIALPFAMLIGSIAAFLMLSRSSELVVFRAAGMSVWQFLLPGILVALFLGAASNVLYNPLAAKAKAWSERLFAEYFNRENTLFQGSGHGAWLRQDGVDGQSVIHGRVSYDQGLHLADVLVFQYDRQHRLAERIEAREAILRDSHWELRDAQVYLPGRPPSRYKRYLVSTYLTPEQVRDSLGSPTSVSFWELPKFIRIAERAGLPAAQYRLQYQFLLAKPLFLVGMVLLAATCSLRAFRFGNTQVMIIAGLFAGFVFFLLVEVSRKMALAGVTSAELAAWGPAVAGCLVASTVLLYQEDG